MGAQEDAEIMNDAKRLCLEGARGNFYVTGGTAGTVTTGPVVNRMAPAVGPGAQLYAYPILISS